MQLHVLTALDNVNYSVPSPYILNKLEDRALSVAPYTEDIENDTVSTPD